MTGWFRGIQAFLGRSEVDESLWYQLEEVLISGDLGPRLADDLLNKLRERSRAGDLRTAGDVERALRQELVGLLTPDPNPLFTLHSSLLLMLVVGVNGAGKTTSVAKLGNFWRKAGRQVLLAAADTFRAAGTEQLEIWAGRADLQCVRGQRGGDPGAVIFDALSAAKARGMDLVVADTAGRLHTRTNLMEELGKLGRVAARQEVPMHSLLVLDATTGQNGIGQARGFREAVGLSGIVLSKLDGTAKGGAVFSIVQEFGVPVLFAGTGERIDDLAEFVPEKFVESLFED